MNLNQTLHCPICNSTKFIAKHQATFTYFYKLDSNNPLDNNNLSFEFDKRENGNSYQYLQCENCGAKFPCDFNLNPNDFNFTISQKAIRSNHTITPHILE
ncbi:MAG: hypothetical protein N4A63_05020 [Vallitalea sp.]|jgi:transcription elongation factor Elf1|nr:hypothetical protein [Vallitalea sp.]